MKNILLFSLLMSCGGKDDSATSTTSTCGDPDGSGTDTGNIPDLSGDWTSSFALEYYTDTCTAENFNQTSETWIGSLTVGGSAPDDLYIYFDSTVTSDTEYFFGAVDRHGGVSFSGPHAHAAGTVYAQFGGLVYHDQYLDRDVIEGSAFLGLDVDDDGLIDCYAKGSWTARKSG